MVEALLKNNVHTIITLVGITVIIIVSNTDRNTDRTDFNGLF